MWCHRLRVLCPAVVFLYRDATFSLPKDLSVRVKQTTCKNPNYYQEITKADWENTDETYTPKRDKRAQELKWGRDVGGKEQRGATWGTKLHNKTQSKLRSTQTYYFITLNKVSEYYQHHFKKINNCLPETYESRNTCFCGMTLQKTHIWSTRPSFLSVRLSLPKRSLPPCSLTREESCRCCQRCSLITAPERKSMSSF